MRHLSFDNKNSILEQYKAAKRRLILLDYDGTLVNIAPYPDAARPDTRVLEILTKLSSDQKNLVVLISGRDKQRIEMWFNIPELLYVAEHGAIFKMPHEGKWKPIEELNTGWKKEVKDMLDDFVGQYKGSFVEDKEFSMVWHYRQANLKNETLEIAEMCEKLLSVDSTIGFTVKRGKKILELTCQSVNKGKTASLVVKQYVPDFLICIGDDITDEDMFRLFTAPEHITIRVGLENTRAKFNLINPGLVISFLETLGSN